MQVLVIKSGQQLLHVKFLGFHYGPFGNQLVVIIPQDVTILRKTVTQNHGMIITFWNKLLCKC